MLLGFKSFAKIVDQAAWLARERVYSGRTPRPGEVLAELKKLEHARRMPRNCCAASSGRREAADGTPYACSQGLPVSSSPPPTLLVLYQPV